MSLRIHAICLALNEEWFISEQLKTLYPFCSGISILSQYDRDWYGEPVSPDGTVREVLDFPDPEGKIRCIVRRWRDEAAARNHEMDAVCAQPDQRIQSHGSPIDEIQSFHATPDYFLIVDADEFYDVDTIDRIIDYLDQHRPRGMRVQAYSYKGTWNRRVTRDDNLFCQFGFIRPNLRFKHCRCLTWNETRLSKALRILRLPDVSERIFGFTTCPREIGMFHHGCWLGERERLMVKHKRHSHQWAHDDAYINGLGGLETEYVSTSDLPRNIREGNWPEKLLENE